MSTKGHSLFFNTNRGALSENARAAPQEGGRPFSEKRTEDMAASVQEATVPEEELVAAASQLRLDDVA